MRTFDSENDAELGAGDEADGDEADGVGLLSGSFEEQEVSSATNAKTSANGRTVCLLTGECCTRFSDRRPRVGTAGPGLRERAMSD